MPGLLKRYFMAVGVILAALFSLAIITKPNPDQLRKVVEEDVAAYEKTHPESLLGPLRESATHDFFLAASYQVKLGDGLNFFYFERSR